MQYVFYVPCETHPTSLVKDMCHPTVITWLLIHQQIHIWNMMIGQTYFFICPKSPLGLAKMLTLAVRLTNIIRDQTCGIEWHYGYISTVYCKNFVDTSNTSSTKGLETSLFFMGVLLLTMLEWNKNT